MSNITETIYTFDFHQYALIMHQEIYNEFMNNISKFKEETIILINGKLVSYLGMPIIIDDTFQLKCAIVEII